MRKTALMRGEHQGEYAVVGSLGGGPKNPVWVYNLRQEPRVELLDGEEKHDYVAREVSGEERAVWPDDHREGASLSQLGENGVLLTRCGSIMG